MRRRKKELKKIVLVNIFIITILLTNIQIFNSNNLWNENNRSDLTDNYLDLELSDNPYLSDYYITGSGDDQDVRLYAENSSSSINNENNFQIEAMSTTDTCYLSEGDLSFEFQNNYTADYILEDTSPFEANNYIQFNLRSDYSSVAINTGTLLNPPPSMTKLTDNNNATYIMVDSVSRVVSINVSANYTGRTYVQSGLHINVGFNRDEILGFFLSLVQSVSEDAYLTIKVYDTTNLIWRNVTNQMFINASFGRHTIKENIVNENLNNIDLSKTCYIQLFYYGASPTQYNVTINEFKLPAFYAFDLPINNQEYVGLEFDLKGKSSTVNGFYAWIRVLDQTEALITQLEISLYKANGTIRRTESQFLNKILEPNTSALIDSLTIKSYQFSGDTLNYFAFNTTKTKNLKLYNYIIVIKSNSSNTVYSLLTLPQSTFGDPDETINHQLLSTPNDGSKWELASISIPTSYTTEPLDACLFKVRVTRGYMPSDFTNPYDEEDTLIIQDLPIQDLQIKTYPYNESSYLTWGIGQWYYNFTTPIVDNVLNNFVVDLSWNKSIISGFKFNVTYTVNAYWIENALSYYNTTYTSNPEWQLNYTFTLSNPNFNNWNFHELWFIYPNYFAAHNLTNPNLNEIFELAVNETGGESKLDDNTSFNKFVLSENVTKNIDGLYSLQLTSWNFLGKTDSYIYYNYNGVEALWETNGFMYGDNISVGLGVKGPSNYISNTGDANVKLFYPETGIPVPGAELDNNTMGVKLDSMFFYDFNNNTIFSVDNSIPVLGNYYLGYFWYNGSAIGSKTLKLYIDDYDVDLTSFFYDPDDNVNVLAGTVKKVYENYSILIGSVNVTGSQYNPNFYPVNQSNINNEYIYEINGIEVPIQLNSFLQNETILNPDEDINVRLQLQNNFEFSDVKVQVKVQLVALANEKWVIDQKISDIQTLKVKGDSLGRDIQDFSLDLTIPTLQSNDEWYGYNSPVRKGGAKTTVTIYVQHSGKLHNIGIYDSPDYALLVNDTQNDFEGYLIALKYNTEKTGETIVKPFERDECNYLPELTTFIVNIYDTNYISSYEQFIYSFGLKLNSKFSNITINPSNPIRGDILNITSRLTTEFGAPISGENVTCQYYDNQVWFNFSSQISDSKAYTSFLINTLDLNDEDQLIFKLIWDGDSLIMRNSQNITVNLYRTHNELAISLQQNVLQIFKNQKTSIKIILSNIGNSELKITSSNITFILDPYLDASIVQINYLKLNQFEPGDSTEIYLEVSVLSLNKFDLTVFIEALNAITKENISIQTTKTFLVYDIPLADYLNAFFTLIIIGSILLIWAVIFLFVRRLIRKIETPIEEPTRKKQRRGRYVKVSELKEIPESKKEEPATIIKDDKVKKKRRMKGKEQLEKQEEKSTDLDSLLKEEGLNDDK